MRKIVAIVFLNAFVFLPMTPCSYAQIAFHEDIDEMVGENQFEMLQDEGAGLPQDLSMDAEAVITGDRSNITLELKGVDILDVLKVLSKKSGLNIVAGKNVRGQVTLFLKNVDVWDALKIILETSELAYEQKGEIIKVITKSDYEALYGKAYADKKVTKLIALQHARAQSVSETLNQLKSTVGRVIVEESTNALIVIDTPEAIKDMEDAVSKIDVPMQTVVFPLRFASAEDLENKLSELVTPNVGTIKVDSRTNKIIITDIPAKLGQIKEIIQSFDEKPRQVLIEAKIIEVVLEDEYALGIDWNAVFKSKSSSASPISLASNAFGTVNVPNTSGPLADLGTSDLAVFTFNSTEDDFNAVISVLEGMGKTNTLSNPRLCVLNNEESSLAVATRQPFVSQTVVQGDTTSTTADNVEFVDVGVTLVVTPTITDDDHVVMAVKPEVSTAGTPLTLESTDSSGNSYTRTVVPIVTSQEVETKVIVKSGSTLVLGGLIQDTQNVSKSKLPFFGDIPFLGTVFQNKSDDFKKTELVIFITPRIVSADDSSGELSRFYDEKGEHLPFNKMGGPGAEFNSASQKSQPYAWLNEKPFWEKRAQPVAKQVPAKKGYEFTIRKDIEQQAALDSLMTTTASEQGYVQDAPTFIANTSPATSVVSDNYFNVLKKQVFDVLRADSALSALSGEVRIQLVVAANGYLTRVNAQSLHKPELNADIILAINRRAPYAAFDARQDQNERNLSFSLFFT